VKRSAAHRNSIRPRERPTGVVIDSPNNAPPADPPLAGFGRVIARSRYAVLIAVVGVLLVSLTLFLLGALNAFAVTWKVWREIRPEETHEKATAKTSKSERPRA
jgi:hypothetical protein